MSTDLAEGNGDKEVVNEECLGGMAVVVLEEEHGEDDDEVLHARVTEGTAHHLHTAYDDEQCGNTATQTQHCNTHTTLQHKHNTATHTQHCNTCTTLQHKHTVVFSARLAQNKN